MINYSDLAHFTLDGIHGFEIRHHKSMEFTGSPWLMRPSLPSAFSEGIGFTQVLRNHPGYDWQRLGMNVPAMDGSQLHLNHLKVP